MRITGTLWRSWFAERVLDRRLDEIVREVELLERAAELGDAAEIAHAVAPERELQQICQRRKAAHRLDRVAR